MSFGKKLRKLRQNRGLTLKELSKNANISVSYLSDLENERSNPSLETLSVIARTLNTFPAALLESDYPLVGEDQGLLNAIKVPLLKKVYYNQPLMQPENIKDEIIIDCRGLKSTKDLVFLPAPDNEMSANRLLQGDLVLVHLQNNVEPGELALVVFAGNHFVFRRIYRAGPYFVLETNNPQYKSLILHEDEQFQTIGRVIGAIINFS